MAYIFKKNHSEKKRNFAKSVSIAFFPLTLLESMTDLSRLVGSNYCSDNIIGSLIGNQVPSSSIRTSTIQESESIPNEHHISKQCETFTSKPIEIFPNIAPVAPR
ncbi:hypothetical protein TNIN_204141 [Trichonephila inaurata madagascariensis]|uniref:Uncharacterized protein n=1 Tax=Trichonephila inaurata madagascariensis TaxID=2747483 RepID=A0A8X6XGY2_9ARAC|nr:hypothetical protein TNIN_204141 [Trichonephila inaurata madagascariensis]